MVPLHTGLLIMSFKKKIFQGIILPQMYTAGIANVLNLGFNYVLIFTLNLGIM